jgi:hypothetical protein
MIFTTRNQACPSIILVDIVATPPCDVGLPRCEACNWTGGLVSLEISNAYSIEMGDSDLRLKRALKHMPITLSILCILPILDLGPHRSAIS